MNKTLYAKVVFEGKTPIEFSKAVKDYLMDEFIKRRTIFVDLVNPMYEQWNSKFDELYPGVDGYDMYVFTPFCIFIIRITWSYNFKVPPHTGQNNSPS